MLQGGRPFAIPEYYNRAAAVLNTVCFVSSRRRYIYIFSVQLTDLQFFPGQSGGQAISDVLFGTINPGGRVPISVPYNVGTLPAFYK